MCLGAEAFTLLAVMEAQDRASEIVARVDEALNSFSETAARAAGIAEASGAKIDESLLQTASGADALDLANARVEASQAKVAAAMDAQANAERALLDAQAAAAAAAEGDIAATSDLTAASTALADAQKAAAKATADLKDAQATQTATAAAQTAADKAAADAAAGAGAAQKTTLATLAAAPGVLKAATIATGAVALGMDALGVHSVKAAGDFQVANNRLATSAGETQANLKLVGDGVLKMSGEVGDSTEELEKGMYLVESAGDHGAAGLNVLKAAAEGAKAEGADMSEVANALTSALNAYGLSADHSVSMTNQMIAAVGAGKMTMQDFSSSLSNVLPVAAAAGIGFDQVGGAVATMTAQGMSAQQATQDLANTIRSLQSPNQVAIQEMQELGLDVNQVSTQLGQKGLTGTLGELTQAITSKMGPAGTVIMDAFNKSKSASEDLQVMLSKMPADLAKLSQSFMSGSTSLADYTKETKSMGGPSAAMGKQFMSLFDASQGFNHQLTSGSPAAQTYTSALGKMLGGATGLNTALMITGDHMATFQGNVKTVGDAAKNAGSDINGWDEIQSNFNQKMAEAHETVSAMFIAIGTALLPVVTKIADALLPVVSAISNWVTHNQDLAATLITVIGTTATVFTAILVGVKVFKSVSSAIDDVGKAFKLLRVVMMDNPWILIATLAVMAIIFIVTHWQQISQFFSDLWDGIKSVATAVWGGITEFFSSVWNKIKSVFSGAIDAVVGFVKDWYPLILGVLSGGILLVPALIFKYWSQITGFVSSVFNAVFGFLQGIWNSITSWLIGTWTKIVNATRPIWEPIVHIIGDIFEILKDIAIIIVDGLAILLIKAWQGIVFAAKAIWTPIADFFSWLWDGISSVATTVWNTITGFISAQWTALVAIARAIWTPVADFFSWLWNGISSVASTVWGAITGFVSAQWEALVAIARAIWTPIADFFSGVWDSVTGVFRGAWDAISGAVQAGINNVIGWVAGIGQRILDGLGNIGSILWNAGSSIIMGFLHGLESAFDSVKNFVGGIADWISAHKGPISVDAQLLTPHGGAIMGGLLQGLRAGAPAVQSYLDKFTTGLSTNTRLSGTLGMSGGGMLGAPAGGNQGAQVVIDLRGSQVVGDNGINLLVDKIGRAVATKILPQAGVRIQM